VPRPSRSRPARSTRKRRSTTRLQRVGPPGTLIRSEPMLFAPADAQAYRVLYRSTGMHGEPIAVSGVIIVPPGPVPPGGRPIVAWAHPTTGVGVAAAAPATSLVPLMGDDFKTAGGKNLTAMTLWSWSRVYGAPIDKVVVPEAMSTVDQLANECIESIFDILARRRTEKPLEQHFLSVPNIAVVEPWRSLAIRNSPGTLPPRIPLFLAQGTTDDIVRPDVTRAYMQRQCGAGSKVAMMWVPGVGHGFVARDSADRAVAWMMDRFAGQPAPSDCGKAVIGNIDAAPSAQ
jgi:hypothetical protein